MAGARNVQWEQYDPAWLVLLAREQLPERPELAAALEECVVCKKRAKYVYFVDAANGNQLGAQWQFRENVWLDDPVKGRLVLDVLQDGRVGGVEFYDQLFSTGMRAGGEGSA